MKDEYKVYALTLDSKCVYVGCSVNVPRRVRSHSLTKKFDNFIIISSHKTKKDALMSERSIIRFLSFFGNEYVLNSPYTDLHIEAVSRGLKEQ